MNKRLSKYILIILVLYLMGEGLIGFITHSTTISEKILTRIFEENIGGVDILDLEIGEQHITPFGVVNFKNFYVELEYDKKIYIVYAQEATYILQSKHLSLYSLFVNGNDIHFNRGVVEFEHDSGNLVFESAKISDYKLTHLHCTFLIQNKEIFIQNFASLFYNGRLLGNIFLSHQGGLTQNINLQFEEVDLTRLRQVNYSTFKNFQGIIDGSVAIKSTGKGEYLIQGSINSIENAQVKAVLLKPLLEHIPNSVQKDQLNLLISENKNVSLEHAIVKFENRGDEKLMSYFDLKSKDLNLNIDLNMDINIEGGLKNILKLQTTLN